MFLNKNKNPLTKFIDEKKLKKKKDCNCGKNKKKINVKGGRLV